MKARFAWLLTQRPSFVAVVVALAFALLSLGCAGPGSSDEVVLTADLPLHLEDHLEAATIEGSEVPADLPEAVEWRFDEPQPDWKRAYPDRFDVEPARIVATEDALSLIFDGERDSDGDLVGGLYVDLPKWQRQEWASVTVRLRADGVRGVGIGFNLTEPTKQGTIQARGEWVYLMADGTPQTYLFPVDSMGGGKFREPWNQLVLWFWGLEAKRLDLLSVSAIPKEAAFNSAPVGLSIESRRDQYRRVLYTHTPSRLTYQVKIPKAGRLDVGLGVVRRDAPVTFRVAVTTVRGGTETMYEETLAPGTEQWVQRSVDLTHLSGQVVNLSLQTEAQVAGTVALWAAPTLSGSGRTARPNVILYVIDNAGADWMSVYGYNRHTTPFLERLAAQGAVFGRSYSNATWTKLSNPSFLTSMYPTALGWYRSLSDRIPEGVTTMVEHFGRVGYQTAFFTSNPYAATLSGLERGVDTLWVGDPPINSTSSDLLHREFWDWREAYPASPYFVHFQTTDVHSPFDSQPPFAGLFQSPDEREEYFRWDEALEEAGGYHNLEAYGKVGTTKERFALAQQALYDECMAHQDYQLGRLVERLKTTGDWANTILIVTSDHGYPAGSHRLMEPMERGAPYFHPFATRIPLIVVWPGHIPPGGRFAEPVSLIDLLPTILELAGLPAPQLAQGRSLARALLDNVEPEPRPVIIDMPSTDLETGELIGTIEVVDGRWGASLVISSRDPGEIPEQVSEHLDGLDSHYGRSQQLVIYDLLQDPFCTRPANEERPDLVEKYRDFLEAKWAENVELRERIGAAGEVQLTPAQMDRLRTLGYVQ